MQPIRFFFLALSFIPVTFNAVAQSEFLGISGSAYIDNLANSQAIGQGARKSLDEGTVETADGSRWYGSATVSYSDVDSKRNWDAESLLLSFNAEVYVETDNGWLGNMTLFAAYSHYQEDSFFDVETWEYSEGMSLQPAYDLLTFWSPANRPETMKHSRVIAGLGIGFADGRGRHESNPFFFPFFSRLETDTHTHHYFVTPNIVFVQPVSKNLTTFLIPAYRMSWSETEYEKFFSDSEVNQGLFTLTGRGDYQLCEKFSASAFATWKRDVYNKPARERQDWAEFGGRLCYALNEEFAVRVGYSYETFHPFTRGNHVFVRLEATF